jgi:hypothetical protein
MSNHLSEDQFVECVLGRPARAELEHVSECSECRAEVDRLVSSVSLFRGTIRRRIDDRIASHTPATIVQPSATRSLQWRWALLAATVVLLIMLPFMTEETKPRLVVEPEVVETNPDAIMNAVTFHLSGTVPTPMEPILFLIPSEQLRTNSGGVR